MARHATSRTSRLWLDVHRDVRDPVRHGPDQRVFDSVCDVVPGARYFFQQPQSVNGTG